MTGALALFRNFLREERAVTAAEFALVVPFFILVVFGTINTSILLSAVIQMHYAAERTARCLAISVAGNCTSTNVNSYAIDFYNGPPVTNLNFALDATNPNVCGSVAGRNVVGTGTYSLVSGFSATNVSISARACYPII